MYSIDSNEFEYDDELLNHTFFEMGSGIFYTQFNATTLFTISGTLGEYINVYNLSSIYSESSFHELTDFPLPQPVNDSACLASSDSLSPQLYITGGDWTNSSNATVSHEVKEPFNVFQIFDLNNYSWSTGRNMHFARHSHGCIVMNDTLWVMGYVAEIETINITDVYNANWSIRNDVQIDNRTRFGLVEVQDLIYIVGGQLRDDYKEYTSSTVYIIDTLSGNMTTELLPYDHGIAGICMVVVDDIIYGFGGFDLDHYYGGIYSFEITDEWLTYHQLSNASVVYLFESAVFIVHFYIHPFTYCHRRNDSICDALYVDISGFEVFTADTLNHNRTLQSTMTDVTYDAILQSASSIDATFFVDFQEASGDLSITFSLCAYEQQALNLVGVITDGSKADINDAISDGLATEFKVDSESITVAISFDEFGFYSEYIYKIYFSVML